MEVSREYNSSCAHQRAPRTGFFVYLLLWVVPQIATHERIWVWEIAAE